MKFSEVNTKARLEHDKVVNRYKDVPEAYDGLERVEVQNIKSTFFVERYHIVTKPDVTKNKESKKWEVKTSKQGKPLTITLAYCMCRDAKTDKRFYFVTKSTQMLPQLWTDEEKKTVYEGRNGEVTVYDMTEGIDEPLEIRFTKVEYNDGKKYDQPLLGVAGSDE